MGVWYSHLMTDTIDNEEKPRWCVYLLECGDGTYYCGVTTDLERRIAQHNEGKGARYTRGRGPVTVAAVSPGCTRSVALKLEALVKKVGRCQKQQLVRSGSLTEDVSDTR
jgi:putative endonuclease